jgi:hypothetical protein
MWVVRLVLAVGLSCLALVSSQAEETRIALVIGNSTYEAVPVLRNPGRDAELVAASLRDRGFAVTLETDLSYDSMRRAIQGFSAKSAQADWALLYYAGHGMEFGGENFLIPTDAQLKSDTDITFEAMPLGHVLQSISRARKLHVIILDACRDNPFASQMSRAIATRAIGRGLARMDPEGGSTLVAFAAKPGQVALDGDGENSPFAASLAKRLAEHVEIRRLFGLVRDDVMRATGGRQQPFLSVSLGGEELFFNVVKPEIASSIPPSGSWLHAPGESSPAPGAKGNSVKTTTVRLDAIDLALQDARERVASGDIPAARAILERFREGGDARALVGLAETYDPTIIRDASYADTMKAQALYLAAGEAGFAGSADRITRLNFYPQPSVTSPPAATPSTLAPAAAQPLTPSPGSEATIVAQSAVLYEEQPEAPQRGQAFQGTVTWRTESVSTGSDAAPQTAIKGEVDIPERKMKARVTIRKNVDPALPATHTMEVQFQVPADGPNGGISNVPGALMKHTAQERGAPLQGLSVKVTNGFFLIGFADSPSDQGRNAQLLTERGWIDVPVLFENGRRAIMTLEKGIPGKQAFAEAFRVWK